MPTYEYLCGACEHAFEKFQKITAGRLRKCPECGKLRLKRLISGGGGIIFRGEGFYCNDYGDKKEQ
jgi:putative FmdB family regulatory protein